MFQTTNQYWCCFSHLGIVGDCCAIHGSSECNAEVGARIIVLTLVEDRDILHPAQELGMWKARSNNGYLRNRN